MLPSCALCRPAHHVPCVDVIARACVIVSSVRITSQGKTAPTNTLLYLVKVPREYGIKEYVKGQE